jgi:ATP-dependent DNA helicase RecQ
VTDADLLKISGVGERKLQLYGNDFLEEIRKFTLQKVADGVRVTGSTQIVTWDLFKNGSTIEEIAQQRGLSTMSIVGHLAFMYEKGEYLDLYQFVSPEELDIITGALPLFSEPYKIGDIYEHFEQRYPYDKIKFAIADMLRKSGST